MQQRLAAEHLGYGTDAFTLYYSPEDDALDWAQALFDSPRGRLGRIDETKLSARDWDKLEKNQARNTLIRFDGGVSDKYGHSYSRTNPGVSSDLILLLRYGLPPGTPERPLERIGPGFWRIPSGYPTAGQ